MQSVCVFAGSRVGNNPEYERAARELGELLAERRIRVIFGGGNRGLMGALADATLARGGEIIGVMPHALERYEVAHCGLTELHWVNSMHERKAMMAERADGFIALPGGFGTLDELFEALTWLQLELHAKPVGLLNAGHFFDPLLTFLDRLASEGFVREADRRAVLVAETSVDVIAAMERFVASPSLAYKLAP
jgi:uncharacterized protein (TIGR00730 family)